jgi:hypothetical protein
MPRNRYTLAGGIIAFLMLANIVYYCFSGWGLITVKVQNEPLGKVIKSIEWQGWVKIYTDIDPTITVSMYVDKVPLPEALETLAANVTIPPPASETSSSGAPDGNGRGGRGGGFGRGAQWNLAFFVGPSSTKVKEMIGSFEKGDAGDNIKTYAYPTMLGFLATSSEDDAPTPTSDPRLQVWPGMKAQVVPVSTNTASPADATNTPPAATPPAPPDSVQGYLRTFAQASDVFIMSDSSWDPPVASPPPASSSMIGAIKSFVGRNHGAVTQAFVLRARGWRGPGGGGRGGFAGGDDTGWSMEDRMRNAANGLPESARASMLGQLDQMAKLRTEMQNAPPEQRQAMRRQQMESRIADNPDGPMRRWSPDKRAQFYQQMVSNRMSAQGK